MKLWKKLLCITLSTSLLFVSSAFAAENDTDALLSSEPHVYDILPDSPEWNAMTLYERRAACYVSAEEAEAMTTDVLVETVMNYPYLGDIYAFNTISMGIEVVSGRFPALSVLLARADAQSALQRYKDAQIQLYRLDSDEPLSIHRAQDLMTYIDSSEVFYVPLSFQTVVKTPKGTNVSVFADRTWSEAGMSASVAQKESENMQKLYSSALIIGNPTPAYNCHSYAWYKASTSNTYWMNDPSAYISDGSYKGASAAVGKKVTYTSSISSVPIHSGIIKSTSTGPTIVTSKWGMLALFTHRVNDSPYTDDPAKFPGVVVNFWEAA
ncbi:MAG: hypothetical protein ACOYIE_02065 [Agathobaculum sp.]|uniref:hypothetical protein n=1 Tax=Agathobaculum sp. TaxID=2048138 RepID=UPI003D94E226